MSANKGKVFILIFLIIFSLSLAALTFYFFQQELGKNKSLQEELEDLRTRQKVGEMKLEDALKKSSEIERQWRDAKYQVEYLTQELENKDLSYQNMLQETDDLKGILKEKEAAENDLRQRLTQTQSRIKDLEEQISQLESEKTLLTNEITNLEEEKSSQSVELGEIVVGSQPTQTAPSIATSSPPQIQKPYITVDEGQVLVVNKKYNFAVIDLGMREGVKFNDTFSVYRGDNYIGDIRVEKVHESMSAAAFLTPGVKDKIRERDRVIPKR